MRQPNSGRITRWPGAVLKMMWIDCSISSASPVRAIILRRSVLGGNCQPRPMIGLLTAHLLLVRESIDLDPRAPRPTTRPGLCQGAYYRTYIAFTRACPAK